MIKDKIIEMIRFKSSSFLNPSRKEKIKNSQPVIAIKGAINAIEISFAKEFNFAAYLIASNVVAIQRIEKTIPTIRAAICESVI